MGPRWDKQRDGEVGISKQSFGGNIKYKISLLVSCIEQSVLLLFILLLSSLLPPPPLLLLLLLLL